MNIPEIVDSWVKERCNFRTPVYSPGDYQNFAESKSSCCWGGNPNRVGDYLISVCQPSAQSKGDKMFLFFDFIEAKK